MDPLNNDHHYDVLILGAGLAGLQCGVILSRHGYKVGVIEKNRHIGGTLQSFSFNGCDFATGLHYIGSLNPGQTLHRLFSYFNLFEGITYHRMDSEGFDVFKIDGKTYSFPQGWEAFRHYLHGCFPEERRAIDQYILAVEKVLEEQPLFELNEAGNLLQEKPSQSVNAWEFICSLTSNHTLRQVLSALNFVYAGDKEATPWYVHALINHYFVSSSYRVVGSSDQIPQRLKSEIEKQHGQVITHQEVDQFVLEDGKLLGVRCSNGNRFYADHIISNIHPATTMGLLEEGQIKKSFRKRLETKTDTLSAFALYIQLKPGKFPYRNHNYNYYEKSDVWYASRYDAENWPEHFFMHFPIDTPDARWVDHLSVVTHMRFEEVEKWKYLSTADRSPEYQKFKKEKAEKLLKLVLKEFPELDELIVSYTAATPLTFRDYVGSPTGSMYGTLRDYKNPLTSYVAARTKIPNLYFTGQNLNLHGVMGVSISALVTCSEFVELGKLLEEIRGV